MKIIKSRLLGTRLVRARDLNIQVFQIRSILSEHRAALLDRILSDLATYVDYKFQQNLRRADVLELAQKLVHLKGRDVEMEFYEPIIKQLQKKDEITLSNDCFFLEIDELIRTNLNPQLHFAA
jgi:hypothetical protein